MRGSLKEVRDFYSQMWKAIPTKAKIGILLFWAGGTILGLLALLALAKYVFS